MFWSSVGSAGRVLTKGIISLTHVPTFASRYRFYFGDSTGVEKKHGIKIVQHKVNKNVNKFVV